MVVPQVVAEENDKYDEGHDPSGNSDKDDRSVVGLQRLRVRLPLHFRHGETIEKPLFLAGWPCQISDREGTHVVDREYRRGPVFQDR